MMAYLIKTVVPFVLTLHDVIFYKYEEYRNLKNRLMITAAKSAEYILTVSDYSKKEIVETLNVPSGKVITIPISINPLLTDVDTSGMDEIRNKFGIRSDYIFYVGSLTPRKNIKTLIEAFSLIKAEDASDFQLVIAGSKTVLYEELLDLQEI